MQSSIQLMNDIAALQQQNITLQRLLDISRDLNSTLDMRALLLRIVQSARDLTASDAASILLVEDTTTLRFAAFCGPQVTELKNAEVPMTESLAGWVVKHNKTSVIDDAQTDKRLYVIEPSSNIRSIVAVPMVFGDQVIGVLENLTHDKPKPFKPEEVETLQTLSSIAAVAVQNARLFQQSDWIAEIVHEIRTPLTSILTSAEILNQHQIDDETRIQITNIIQHEAERVSKLVHQFLELAQFESGRMLIQSTPCSIQRIVDQATTCIQPQADEHAMRIIKQCPETLPQARGDPERLEQVLVNLLSNAVKYAGPQTDITVSCRAANDSIVISVIDEGPGIPPKHRERLFKRFSRLPGSEDQAVGSGLGLHIARKIIEAHGGRIWVESEVGKGSTFAFSVHRYDST